MRNLQPIMDYLENKNIFYNICNSAPSDNMPYNTYFILNLFQDLPEKYIDGLEKTLERNNIGFGYEDEFIIDYDTNTCYHYTQCYHTGYNFIIGDGYIIGEDSDLDSFDASEIVNAIIPNMNGNIGCLPENGNIFNRLAELEETHCIDLVSYCHQWNYYDAKWIIEAMAKRFPNWYFICKEQSRMEVITIRKGKV